MKKCTICKEEKSLLQYYKNNRARDGFSAHCKLCHKIFHDRWMKNNTEKKREINRRAMRIYRNRHPEKSRISNRKCWIRNGKKYKETARNKNRLERQNIINRYGGKCECCGINDYRFLCLDHKNNDGYNHRKSIRAGWGLHRWIKTNNYHT